jgi:hypothetical protein
MTRQTPDSKNRDGDTNITVLFGTDEHGKPRAAYFEAVDSDLMTRAAAAMKLQLLRPITASEIELAKKLPVGRIHANGTGFVPPIRPDLYSALQLAAKHLPKNWDSIEVGDLVIALENLNEGWWEAIVMATDKDMLTVKYRDYPTFPRFSLHRTAVALMKPAAADA